MIEIFKEFQSFLSSKPIIIENTNLNKVFKMFSFQLFTKENHNQQTISNIDYISNFLHKNKYRDIIISYYLETERKYQFLSDFFIVCFENTILIIEESEFDNFYQFFSQNQESTIYIEDTKIKSIIEQKIDIPLHFSIISENCLFQSKKLSLSFEINTKKKKLLNFFELIFEIISNFLIQKSYNKLVNYDRVLKYEDYKKKFDDININDDEYIKLQELNEDKNINLIYHIERGEILILKLFFDYRANDLFERETRNYLNIHYPFFPKLIGKTELYSYQCLIIEYIHGNTLDKIKDMKLNIELKIKIVFQIMIALNYLHCNEFLYRDFKPDNIIINKNGSTTIIDFDRMIMNTQNFQSTRDFQLEYIAPEILEGKSFSKKSDIYSLGKIINFIFSDEFSNKEKSKEITVLYEIYEKCTKIDEDKRPNILDLIDEFYIDLISKLSMFENAIQDENIFYQNHYNFDFLFYISEYDNPTSKHQISQLTKSKLLENKKHSEKEIYITFNDNSISLNSIIILANKLNKVTAQFFLGTIYEIGEQVEQDINKSIYYYTLAANQNYPDAQCKLGEIYEKGEYIPVDINKSMYYYTLAADQNHLFAQQILGMIYGNGELIQRDINKSIYYFTLAANQNDDFSQLILGKIYACNKYVPLDMNKAIHYFTLAANQNNHEAQYHLGFIYKTGELIPRNINKSIYYFTLASNQNDQDAQYQLGEIYGYGELIPIDINKAIHYFSLAASQNHSKALFNLGVIYQEGEYIERNVNKSIYYFSLAADQNNSNAQFNLGVIYENGEFIERDINKSIHYYTLAANQNHPLALYNLGIIYNTGKFIKTDITKAINFFTLSAEQNCSLAQYNLGVIFSEGRRVARDINKSINYYVLAANQNNLDALFNLGVMYANGQYVKQDINKAIHYFTCAADQNHMKSQYNLGTIYGTGQYTKPNINKAIHYYTLAANQNNVDAQYNLGCIYETNENNQQNINKAIHFYTLAADQNYTKAQFSLGLIFLYGEHIPRDINKAIHYFTLAANKNDSDAQSILGVIYEKGEYIKRNIKKSIHYYSLAADKNDSVALYNLGIMYICGKYVQQDINKSIHFFTLAANLNDPDAQYQLGKIYGDGVYITKDINKSIHYFTLAVNQNHPYSLMKFGFLYLTGTYFQKNLKKSLHYYMQAAIHKIIEANYYIALFYCQGLCIRKDIDEAISHFKETSSFNDQYSKNNLGILYKNVKRNTIAIEYFEEAIRQKNDKLSMYNLGHIYFYGDFIKKDIDKSIELFIKSSNVGFYPSKIMLGLAIIKKIEIFSINNISNELKNHGNESDELNQEIYSIIQKNKLQYDFYYTLLYSSYEKKEYFYDIFYNEVIYLDFMNENKPETIKNDEKKIIDESFYEAFYF